MKTAISIPDALFRAAESLAERLGVSRSKLYQLAMTRMLAEHEDIATTEALNRIYSEEPELSDLDSYCNGLQFASQNEDDW
jgi:hypothetical protein